MIEHIRVFGPRGWVGCGYALCRRGARQYAVFTAEGIRILASLPQAPRASAVRERIIGTLRRELSGRSLTSMSTICTGC